MWKHSNTGEHTSRVQKKSSSTPITRTWSTLQHQRYNRQARWAELLAHFGKFTIIYQPGPKMGKPDALTRSQDLQGGLVCYICEQDVGGFWETEEDVRCTRLTR